MDYKSLNLSFHLFELSYIYYGEIWNNFFLCLVETIGLKEKQKKRKEKKRLQKSK